MRTERPAAAQDRVLFQLKTKGPRTAAQLAQHLDVTPMAVRQHLYALATAGLVVHADERRRVGRPARIWRLAPAAEARFPDSHAELAVGMLAAARATFGEKGLSKLLSERTRAQLAAYRARLPGPEAPLEKRVAALADLRRDEGYMAEWSRERDGSLLLVENHCPIWATARLCEGLCGGEIALFRSVLGRGVSVERTEHLVKGARRCVYRIARA
ncbi:MAG: transcriptional regulator [Planctomycetes bacterium]|nr:transcriptional regulator [Planctomycetota bacterium]